jgi:hypothetical protein
MHYVRSALIVYVVMLLACSKRDAPDVAAAAGKVVELTGTVRASRAAAAPRALTVGDQVFADDIVDTGGDGSVTIELFHNRARWAMEPQQKKRVDESAAWRLAKQDATGPADHSTSAAGRNAERAAAETRATSGAGSAANSAAPPPEPQAVAPIESPPVKPEAPKGTKDGKTSSAPAPGAGGGTQEQNRDRGLQQPRLGSAAEPQKPRTLDALTGQQAALAACIAVGAKVTITVHVVKGKATAVDNDAKRKACLDAVLAKIELPAVDEDVSLQLAR